MLLWCNLLASHQSQTNAFIPRKVTKYRHDWSDKLQLLSLVGICLIQACCLGNYIGHVPMWVSLKQF